MQEIKSSNPLTTILVINLGFIAIYYLTNWQYALLIALCIGILGLLSPKAAQIIDYLWMKLAYVLSLIVPKILLFIIFFFLLFPLARLARLFTKKDNLNLKKTDSSLFENTEKNITASSFEKLW